MELRVTSKSDLAFQLLDVVPSLMHQMRGEIRAGYKDALTVPQFRVLTGIRRGLLYVGQIAEHHGVSQPAMSRMVASLVRRGLVRRVPRPEDRRQMKLVLTAKGRALARQTRVSSARHLSRRLRAIDRDERQRLSRALKEIATLLLQRSEG